MLINKLRQLHKVRGRRLEKEAEIKKATLDLWATPEWQRLADLQTELESLDDELKAARDEVARDSLAEYAAHPESKDIAPGVKIRVMVNLEYDLTLAEAWCNLHYPLAFRLDTGMFEAQMRQLARNAGNKSNGDTLLPPFVKFVANPTVTITSDLSKVLEQEAEDASSSDG